jgi:PGF-pre-PGF domain-containing protein
MKKGDLKCLNFKVFFAFFILVFSFGILSAISLSGMNYVVTSNSINISFSVSEEANVSINYGTTTSLGTLAINTSYLTSFYFSFSGLNPSTIYYSNITICNALSECNTTGTYNITTSSADSVYPIFSNYWDNNGSLIDSGTVMINVTVSDTNGTVILNLGGQDFTATNNSGDATRFNVSLFAGSGGIYTYYWKAYGNGINHNYNSSGNRKYTINVSIDTTSPVVNLMSPADNLILNSGSGISFIFNVTDKSPILNCSLIINGNLSKTSTSITKNISQTITYSLPISVYNWQINCTDNSNNIGTSLTRILYINSTWSFVINSTNISTTPNNSDLSENVPYTIIKNISVLPNNLAFFDGINPLFGIIGFYVLTNTEAQNAQIVITRFDDKPDATGNPENINVYKYLEVHPENLENKLTSFTFVFSVYKNWTASRGIEKEKIALFHYNESTSKWIEVPTSFLREETDSYVYTSNISSFSYFYIGESLLNGGTISGTSGSLKTNLFWIIVCILIAVFLFILIMWILFFNKKRQQNKETKEAQIIPELPAEGGPVPLPPPTIDQIQAENESSKQEDESDRESVFENFNPNDSEKSIPEETNSDELQKDISDLKNQINEKEKKHAFFDNGK